MAPISYKTLFAALLGISRVAAQCEPAEVNEATMDLVTSWEEWYDQPQTNAAGVWVVGYSHYCEDESCSEVTYPFPISREDGRALLNADMANSEVCVSQHVDPSVTLNANQFGALVSWAYNIRCPLASDSDLVHRLNSGENPKDVVEYELPRWKFAGGIELPMLGRRRQAEIDLFNTETQEPGLPMECKGLNIEIGI